MNASSHLYRRHRFPIAIVSHAVYLYFRFLYFRFAVSYHDVEELLAVRGICREKSAFCHRSLHHVPHSISPFP